MAAPSSLSLSLRWLHISPRDSRIVGPLSARVKSAARNNGRLITRHRRCGLPRASSCGSGPHAGGGNSASARRAKRLYPSGHRLPVVVQGSLFRSRILEKLHLRTHYVSSLYRDFMRYYQWTICCKIRLSESNFFFRLPHSTAALIHNIKI